MGKQRGSCRAEQAVQFRNQRYVCDMILHVNQPAAVVTWALTSYIRQKSPWQYSRTLAMKQLNSISKKLHCQSYTIKSEKKNNIAPRDAIYFHLGRQGGLKYATKKNTIIKPQECMYHRHIQGALIRLYGGGPRFNFSSPTFEQHHM